ncbi:DUF2232 domain-containing protein [Paenibacillus xerothermodurans]|uniref:DUF2232 domain-containing protein n=1 Tax=Paenibacillus xerothermodurans TaxID=1977292 RepID=A0A2W1N617_PAEXE|nr:DUF2232 domain-containing protein [Paenibacillus xerothermodurans]PZE19070.1 DUF2232 domain-containing protein [Paenibacillus xerothermodurans]
MLGKGLAKGLGWSVITVILLLSVITPLNIITMNLLMVPVLIQFVRYDVKRFLLVYGISLAAVYVLTSMLMIGWVGLLLISVSLFLLPPVIQMGNLYRRRAAARTVVTVGTLTLLAEMLLSILVAYMFGFNLIAKMRQFMLESLNTLPDQLKGLLAMDPADVVRVISQMLPMMMIGFSIVLVVITHWISRRILNRGGADIPGFKPVHEWRLPRSFLWYYMIALLMELFVQDPDSGVYMVLLNLLPLLTMAFAVQAIAFLFFVAHANRWNRLLPVTGIVLLVLFFPLTYFLFSLLGVFDVAFPIRERMARK